jgi:hypothetical protein
MYSSLLLAEAPRTARKSLLYAKINGHFVEMTECCTVGAAECDTPEEYVKRGTTPTSDVKFLGTFTTYKLMNDRGTTSTHNHAQEHWAFYRTYHRDYRKEK